MPTPDTAASEPARPKRLTLSEIVEQLLQRSGGDRSSVSLNRNAKGATQIEVTVRTGSDDDDRTVEQAASKAHTIYDGLRLRYPMPDDDAPIAVPPEGDQAAEIRRRAERWIADTPNADDTPTQLARDVLALLHSLRVEAAVRAGAWEAAT